MGAIAGRGDVNVHGGAPFDTGLSTNVFINGKGVALKDQTGSSQNDNLYNQNSRSHPQGVSSNQKAVGGSSTVFVNGKAVHRIGDARIDGATGFPPGEDVATRNKNQAG